MSKHVKKIAVILKIRYKLKICFRQNTMFSKRDVYYNNISYQGLLTVLSQGQVWPHTSDELDMMECKNEEDLLVFDNLPG